jgi:adenylate cyclase
MPASEFQLRVIDEGKTVLDRVFSKRVEIGRQDRGEPAPYSCEFQNDRWRLVIAPLKEDTVSRHHLVFEPLENGRFRVENVSKNIPIQLNTGELVKPGEVRELLIPTQMMLGRKIIRVLLHEEEAKVVTQELPEATLPPGAYDALATRQGTMPLILPIKGTDAPNFGAMIRWLRAAMEVLQAAATSSDFYLKAAQAASEMVGLDSASVLLLKDDEWMVEAHYSPRLPALSRAPASRHVLNKVRQKAKTLWEKPEANASGTGSLESIAAVVAAPILNRQGEVIGALYGDRSFLSQSTRDHGDINEVQAMLVELLAGGIAAGLERLRHEQNAVKERVRFEQFFTLDLAKQLEKEPDLLKGKDTEVTLLFCDIRGFSRISEKLGPAMTVEWINDVMGVLSDSVLAHQGVLVDYIGDELMAMWGAPTEQPDHAIRACRAALDMLKQLPGVVARWKPILNEEFDLGIGINTGMARVGNTGTKLKFKYGPLGNTVNLASRIQGATKHFKARLLITEMTKAAVDLHAEDDQTFCTRRLGKIQVVNIGQPVDIYEVVPDDYEDWPTLKAACEDALDKYLAGNFREAAGTLAHIQVAHPTDGPSLILLARAVNCLCDPKLFSPVWILDSK